MNKNGFLTLALSLGMEKRLAEARETGNTPWLRAGEECNHCDVATYPAMASGRAMLRLNEDMNCFFARWLVPLPVVVGVMAGVLNTLSANLTSSIQ